MTAYAVNNRLAGTQQNLSTSYKTIVRVAAAATPLARGRMYALDAGPDGVPNATDCPISWDISRCTTAGTGTSATPNPLDIASGAAVSVATVNHTAEPTITSASSLFAVAANQRAAISWRARPGSELVWPAAADDGLVIRALSSNYATVVLANVLFDE